MRILHCPTITGGNPQNISKAEKMIGQNSYSITFKQNYLGYYVDEVLWDENTPLILQQIKAWNLLFHARKNFDVIHYNSGTPILPWDIPNVFCSSNVILRLILQSYVNFCRFTEQFILRKKVIAVTFQGDDARQGDHSLKMFKYSIAAEVDSNYYSKHSDHRKRNRIKMFDHYADLIYALNPDLLHVLPTRAEFMPYAIEDDFNYKLIDDYSCEIPFIVHAPSHRGAKGTKYVLSAIETLKAEGFIFDFLLIENLSNAEAKKLYTKSCLIVDQLLAGWYGALAVEAMLLSKPVISYIREEDLHFIPKKMQDELPIINADPSSICDVLRDWLSKDKNEFLVRGAIGKKFASKWHNPIEIATKLVGDYHYIALNKNKKSSKKIYKLF